MNIQATQAVLPQLTRAASTPASASTGSLNSAITSAGGGQTLNYQDFLKMLTTELTNQDPNNTQDATQMAAQLAQFSTVSGVDQMVANQTQAQASSLLGKTVTATSASSGGISNTVTGPVTGVRYDSSGSVYVTVNDPTAGSTEVTVGSVTKISN
jgi:flagellar basal-body rod modification protein FlgD